MFLVQSGIGYNIMRIFLPEQVPSVLTPKAPKTLTFDI